MNIQTNLRSRVRPALRHACILLALCASARAVIIQPNTATASSNASPTSSYTPTNTINGSGLLGPVATLPNHGPYTATPGEHWTTASGDVLTAWIKWGFTNPQTLDTIYLWNHQPSSFAPSQFYDVGNFVLTFYNSSDVVIGTSYSGTMAFNTNAAQAFNFGALAGISSVRLDINSIEGTGPNMPNFTGLAEVAFNTTTINPNNTPDAASTAGLLGLSLLGLAFFSRRLSPA